MSKKRRSNFKSKVRRDSERQKQAAHSYGYLNLPKDVSVFNAPPGGRVRLDFIPYEVTDKHHPDRDDELDIATEETLWYKRPFKIHRNIGVENDNVVCLTSIGQKCPICEYRNKLMKEGADKEDTDALKQSRRNLYIVIPHGTKDFEQEPHIWDISQYLFQNLLNEELEEDEDNAVFPALEDGLIVKVRFDSSSIGKSKPFAEASRIDFIDRTEQYTEDILDEVPNLDEVLEIMTYKQLEAKLLELDDEAEADEVEDIPEEEDEAPKRKRKRKTTKEEEPEPEEEEEEEDEDEEEEEKPKRSKRKRRKEKEKEKGDDKCPSDHEFGVDCEEYDDCDDCEVWNKCIAEQERLAEKEKK